MPSFCAEPSAQQEPSPVLGSDASGDLNAMDKVELQELARTLRHTLELRESQLETKFREVASMQEVTQQLMVTFVFICISQYILAIAWPIRHQLTCELLLTGGVSFLCLKNPGWYVISQIS